MGMDEHDWFYNVACMLDVIHKATAAGPQYAWYAAQAIDKLAELKAERMAPPPEDMPVEEPAPIFPKTVGVKFNG